jgi:hypothetical protein
MIKINKIEIAHAEFKRAVELYKAGMTRQDLKRYLKAYTVYIKVSEKPFSFGYSFLDLKE